MKNVNNTQIIKCPSRAKARIVAKEQGGKIKDNGSTFKGVDRWTVVITNNVIDKVVNKSVSKPLVNTQPVNSSNVNTPSLNPANRSVLRLNKKTKKVYTSFNKIASAVAESLSGVKMAKYSHTLTKVNNETPANCTVFTKKVFTKNRKAL